MPKTRRRLSAVAVLVVVLTACSGRASTVLESVTTNPVATAPSASTSEAPKPDASTTQPPATEVPASGPDYRWQTGDCFDFGRENDLAELPYAPYGTESRVPCDERHTHEVYHVDVQPEGAGDPFPDDFDARVEAQCSRAFLDTFGLLWPDSTISIIRYLPDEQEWTDGERYLACVSFRPGQGRTVDRTVGSAAAGDVTWRTVVGACYAGDLGAIRQAPAVDCGDRHVFEVIADEAHPAAEGAPYPGDDALLDFMDAVCGEALDGYVDPQSGPVGSLPLRFTAAEWDLGYRRIVCVAVATDGEIVFEVTGSFDGDWEVVGVLGGDVVTA